MGKEEIIRAYREDPKPYIGAKIARRLKVSRQRVQQVLGDEGISLKRSEPILCRACGKELRRRYKHRLCFGCYWRMRREVKRKG